MTDDMATRSGSAEVATHRVTLGPDHLTVAGMRTFIAELEHATRAGALVLRIESPGPDFCLGRLQGETGTGLSREESLRLILAANDRLAGFPGVSVCAVQGRVLGFGCGVAVQADLTIAARDAVLAFDEVEHGLAPLVVAEYLPRFVGPKTAAELLLTGRRLSAEEARALDMVNEVVDPDQLVERTDELVAGLASREPGALRLMKEFFVQHRHGDLRDPRDEAVTRLDRWLSAGRPAMPGTVLAGTAS